MPKYRYQGPHDPGPQTVEAENAERDDSDKDLVVFINPTSFNGAAYPQSTAALLVRVAGEIEQLEP
jgi:hypothetical protein